MNIIQVEEVTKKFGNFTALDKLSLQVNEGDICGFIGPNGAGKTTTIRILLGLLQATSGKATIFGKDVWENAVEIHKRIAYVPGEVNLWPNLTGGETIDFLTRLSGRVDQKRRDELIERFDFDPSKKCRTYSKGNRQKVALIAALSTDADLYILDEPTSGLDPLMEAVFQETIQELSQQGKTIFQSSHILSEVEKVCNHICIIRDGKIIESGSLDDLRHLTRLHLSVETKQAVIGLDTIDGIHDLEGNLKRFTCHVDRDKIGDVIKKISEYHLIHLESTPPTLEDLFIRHYKGGDHGEKDASAL